MDTTTPVRPRAFVDVETTGLRWTSHDVWEVGLVLVDDMLGRTESIWQLAVNIVAADPDALAVGRFTERRWGPDVLTPAAIFARDFVALTHGAQFIGANPGFDIAFLSRIIWDAGYEPSWHYRPLCVQSFAAGRMGWPEPLGLVPTAHALGVAVDDAVAHTALGDALLAEAVYDEVLRRTEVPA